MRIMWLGLVVTTLVESAVATTLPDGFVESLVAGGISRPTAMAVAPDGRIFVCQQGGQLRVIKNGALLENPFLTVAVDSNGERGLLGVALDPEFASNGYLYTYYTPNTTPRRNRVVRWRANGDVAASNESFLVAELDSLSSATNHNGGALQFGADGKLYVAVGDNANGSNSQTLANRLGKMLRYNPDGSIPEDNPFFATATGDNRAIWAMGLRNPFTFAVQPGVGRMYINDVGQSTWEEINEGVPGANYGWPTTEGAFDPSAFPAFTSPIYAYGHNTGEPRGCSIIGGAFYNTAFRQFPPAYDGRYFFADLCGAWLYTLDPETKTVSPFATGLSGQVVDVRLDRDGSLLYLSRTGAGVYRISYDSGVYTSADAGNALRAVAGLVELTPDALRGLDVERDEGAGRIDLADAVAIARLVGK